MSSVTKIIFSPVSPFLHSFQTLITLQLKNVPSYPGALSLTPAGLGPLSAAAPVTLCVTACLESFLLVSSSELPFLKVPSLSRLCHLFRSDPCVIRPVKLPLSFPARVGLLCFPEMCPYGPLSWHPVPAAPSFSGVFACIWDWVSQC